MTEDEATLARCVNNLMVKRGSATLRIGIAELVALIAQVQLALRHPANKGEGATLARLIIEDAIAGMEAHEPEIGPLLRRGFDPAYDV